MGRVTAIESGRGDARLGHPQPQALRAAGRRDPRARRAARPDGADHGVRAPRARRRRRHGADPHRRLGAVASSPSRSRAGSAAAGSCTSSTGTRSTASRCRSPGRAPRRCSPPTGSSTPPTSRTRCRSCRIKRRHEVAEALDDERLADVLGELPEADQVVILGTLEERRAADVLEAMDPDDAADVLAEFSNVDRNRLLELMEPDEAEPVRQLLKYSEDTAGGMMTSEPVILSPDATIAEALARVREPELTPVAGQPGVRLPAAVGHARPAATWAWRTSSGCSANRRPAWSAASSTTSSRSGRRRRWPRSPATSPPTTWSPPRWSTTRAGWSAR